jgi:polyphosphate:AMP phosphotransferase
MFEVAELGRRVSKKDFAQREPALRTALLEAQRQLRAAGIPVIVIVSGVEGAGKGEVVNRFHAWLDSRWVETHAYFNETDEERERPWEWRFWRTLPPRGSIGILFGSWYTVPVVRRAYGEYDDAALEKDMVAVNELERMLTADGALVVKLWFHLSKEEQTERLKNDKQKYWSVASPVAKKFSRRYARFLQASELAIRHTDTGDCPWFLIEGTDGRYRDLTAGETLLRAIERRLAHPPELPSAKGIAEAMAAMDAPVNQPTILDQVNLAARIKGSYEKELERQQRHLHKLSIAAFQQGRSSVAVFEGWDAAGKGGAIRRVTAALDARLYRVISTAAPTDEEKAHHYLWRFWRHVPRAGYVTIYDRSWYGRVLVERVEGFAPEEAWMRAYQEINDFEQRLHERGIVVNKFWLHISPAEQLRRFEERQVTPWKQHKITEDDWRNREKWEAYRGAVNDMVARTSTHFAPWHLIPSEDKQYARIAVLKALSASLEEVLD